MKGLTTLHTFADLRRGDLLRAGIPGGEVWYKVTSVVSERRYSIREVRWWEWFWYLHLADFRSAFSPRRS